MLRPIRDIGLFCAALASIVALFIVATLDEVLTRLFPRRPIS